MTRPDYPTNQPGHLPPPGGHPYSGWTPAPPPQNSGLAVASLVLGIVGLVVSWFTFGIPSLLALIFGIIGIRQTGPGQRAGRGMAVAGTLLGGVILALGVWVSAALIYSFGSTPESLSAPTADQVTAAPMPAIPSEQAEANKAASKAPPAPPAPTANPKPAPVLTAAQENAIGTAKDYLESGHFSRSGLINQLEFEEYSKADATFAVDHITVNWNEQAVGTARDCLETGHFSRGGLINQLEFEGYTRAQATYAANKVGL